MNNNMRYKECTVAHLTKCPCTAVSQRSDHKNDDWTKKEKKSLSISGNDGAFQKDEQINTQLYCGMEGLKKTMKLEHILLQCLCGKEEDIQ